MVFGHICIAPQLTMMYTMPAILCGKKISNAQYVALRDIEFVTVDPAKGKFMNSFI